MSNKYLVTGAAGFIGSHLTAALLKAGYGVVGLDNFDPFYDESLKRANISALPEGRFHFVEGDILDGNLMREVMRTHSPDLVVHVAALAGVRSSIENPRRYAEVNVGGLTQVLEAMRAGGCRKLVFASSSSVYGDNEKIPFAEEDPVQQQISPYAATKRTGELLCQTYGTVYGFSTAALRFFTVFGPAQRPDLAIGKFMRLIHAGEEVPMFGDGTTSRDYTYIDDILQGVLAAGRKIESAEPGFFRLWNLGHSEPVRLDAMIETIGHVVGKPPRLKRLPMQPGDVRRTYADLTRSTKELGYQPEVDFEDGLRRQWAWIQGQG